MTNAHEVLEELREPARSLRRAIPDTWKAFGDLHGSTMRDGALLGRDKELIALAIAVVKRCDGCIARHAKAAADHGVTPAEVAEAIGVAVLMDGGTATVYGPRAWAAYQEFMTNATDSRAVAS